jgi:hypothetical protein
MRSHILLLEIRRNWTPPDGLDHTRPRSTALTGAGKAVTVVALALLAGAVVAAVALGVKARQDARYVRLLREDGVAADGRVTRVWRERGESRQPWISYRFESGGTVYGRNAKVPLRLWSALQPGARIPVRYVPAKPDLSYPLDLAMEPMPFWVPIVVPLGLAAGCPLMFLSVRRQRRLLEEGRPAPGIVVTHGKPIRSSHGGKRGVPWHYEFHLLSGAIVRGKAGPYNNPPAVGSPITVLYDPDCPRKNVPYPIPSALVRLAYRPRVRT